jgi:hypothetical protein
MAIVTAVLIEGIVDLLRRVFDPSFQVNDLIGYKYFLTPLDKNPFLICDILKLQIVR